MTRLVFAVFFILLLAVSSVSGTTAPQKTIHLTNADAVSAGFSPDELLISDTATLGNGYSNTLNIDHFAYRNLCEATNDVPAAWYDESGTRELRSLWLTWDTNCLFIAVQADAIGEMNEVLLLIDTDPVTGITNMITPPDYTSPKVEEVNLLLNGFSANLVIRMECDEGSGNYYGTPVFGTTYMQIRPVSGTWISTNMQSLENGFYAWYNTLAQPVVAERLFMVRIPWSMLYQTVNDPSSLTLRIAAFSTGPYSENPATVYDAIPQGSSSAPGTASLYIQDNWFSITVTDGSGNILTGVSPRDTAGINFYPGAHDVPSLVRPLLLEPDAGGTVATNSVTFGWKSAATDVKQTVSYRLYLGTNAAFEGGTGAAGILITRTSALPAVSLAAVLLACLALPLVSRKRVRRLLMVLLLLAGIIACGDDPAPAPPATADQEYRYTGLENGTTYHWKIRATDSDGYYIDSETRTFTTSY